MKYLKCMCSVFAGVFVLLQVYAFLQYLKDRLTRHEFQTLFFLGVSVAAGVVFLSVIYLTYIGWFTWKVSDTFTAPAVCLSSPIRSWIVLKTIRVSVRYHI